MITDAYLLLSDAQADVRSAATYVSANTIDLSVARDIGGGEQLKVVFSIDVAFAGGTAVQFQIITSAAADLSSPTVLASTAAIADASLTAGKQIVLGIPPVDGKGQRYLGVQYVGTGTHTAGSITARVVKDADNVDYYASGFSVA